MSIDTIDRNTLRGAPRWVHGFSWGITGAFTLLLIVLYLIYRNTDVWLFLQNWTEPQQSVPSARRLIETQTTLKGGHSSKNSIETAGVFPWSSKILAVMERARTIWKMSGETGTVKE